MPYQLYETVAFGTSKAGLTTVGYQLFDGEANAVGGRVTGGIEDLRDGTYGAEVTFPTGFIGRITWDTGEATPVFASAGASPGEADAILSEEIADIQDNLTRLDGIVDDGGLSTASGTTPDTVVRAGVPTRDDCPILTRISAFIVDQGVEATIEHVARDRKGRVADLSSYLPDADGPDSQSSVSSMSVLTPTGSVVLRAKDWLGVGLGSGNNPVWEIDGYSNHPGSGLLRATLPDTLVARAGIYELSWGVKDGSGRVVAVYAGILSVERSLWGDTVEVLRSSGPPTLRELRMLMMDSSAAENLLLDDVEFSDEQILLALTEPIRLWNETPPPIRTFTTRDFPFRGAWASGALGRLHLMAANHYRRNVMQSTASGTQVQDKDKEREYLAEGGRLWAEYREWMESKKTQINLSLFDGNVSSAYSAIGGW